MEHDEALLLSDLRGVVATGMTVKGHSAIGARFEGADLSKAVFANVALSLARFQGATLNGALFDRCELHESSFAKARLEGTRFVKTTVYGASWRKLVWRAPPSVRYPPIRKPAGRPILRRVPVR
jgi:uncharacterized protein YjbI with pentapeptide repeats